MKKNIKKILVYLGLIGLPATAVATTMSVKKDLEENISNKLDEIEEDLSEIENINKEINEIKEDLSEIKEDLSEIEECIDITYSTDEMEVSKDNEVDYSQETADEIALDYFNTLKHDVARISSYENVEKFKDSIIQAFISLTDFIFFDSELDGIKFKDLTTEAKATIITTYVEIDQLIMDIYPNYKDNLSNKYDTVKEFFKELYESNLNEDTKKNIEETSDKLSEVADLAGEYAGGVYDNAKTKVKTWYDEFKINHQ